MYYTQTFPIIFLLCNVEITQSKISSHHKLINGYEVIYPRTQYFDNSQKVITRNQHQDTKHKANVNFQGLGTKFRINLKKNSKILTSNTHFHLLNETGNVVGKHRVENCYYNGQLMGDDQSFVSLSLCNGVLGLINTGDSKRYYIQPIHKRGAVNIETQPHILRQISPELSIKNFFLDHKTDLINFDDDREKDPLRFKRSKRSEETGEKTIETLLTLDRSMAQFYGVDAAKEYALTVANVAHNILRDSSIGPNPINLVISKMVVMTTPLPDLTINHHAENTLQSFGRWAERRNEISQANDDKPAYDFAVLMTKQDICKDQNQPCESTGLTYTVGMCDGDRSAAVIKADGFNAAFSLAHQIGHSLGIEDDGVGNACESGQHIMASGSGKAAEAYRWSKCSSDYLQGFLRKNQSKCLDHFTSQSSKRENLELYGNAGNVYDVDSQCLFALGDGAKACYQPDKDQICSELMCLHPIYSNCTKTRKPALDGTRCGKDLWCQTGVCVKKGVRDDLVIDGGWSPWKDYVICSRTCGGGVSYRERVCDQPSPQNGGKYCEGRAREYNICNEKPCIESDESFRQQQCKEQNNTFYEDRLSNWTSLENFDESGCQLTCASEADSKITKSFGIVRDGTECRIANIPGRCVQGECNPVGCNMELGSLSVNDRCGICNGDGGTCTTDENIVNNTLANSRMIVNRNLMQRLVTLEDQKSGQFENVAKRLTQLRSLMTDVVTKKCDGDTNCMQRYGLSKKDRIETRPSEIYKWKMVTSGCSASCGTGVETLFPECRRVDDGTPVTNMICEKNTEKPNKMTRSCTHAPCPPRWTTSKWSSCSRTCGTGKKTRNVYCSLNINTEEFLLPSNQCKEHDKPLQLMSCNVQSCPARWTTTPFGECSSTCGIGHRRRDVTCRHVDNTDGFLKTLPDSDCGRASKPLQQIVCNAHNPCPGYRKCGGIYNATSGTISSPNFPGNYTKNIECVHEIDTSQGKTIRLNFTSFNVASSRSEISNECQGDFLRIIDGKCSQQNHRPFTKLCGRQTPGYFDSTGNHFCIKFVSDDDAMTDRGFSLRYEILKKKEKKNELINPTTDICDKQNDVITAPLGIVTSPNYPSNYPANENCGIDFVSPTNESSGYMLKFDSLNIGTRSGIMDCHTDYLEVEYNDKKERICGKELVVPSIHIPASKFRLNFRSSPYPLKQKGFVLTFVTKKFAEENSLDKNSAMKIGNFTQTIQDWHGQLGNETNQSNERESEKGDDFIQPASEVRKKSSIDHVDPRGKQAKDHHQIKDEKQTKEHEQDIKREKIELLKVLVELAKVNPSKLKNALKRNRLIRQRGNKLTTAKRKLTKTKTNEDDKKSINSKKDIIAKISPSNKLSDETSRNNLENKKDNIYTIIMDDLQKEIGKISSDGKKTNVKKSKIEAEPRDSIYEIVMDPGFDDDLSIAGVEQTAKKVQNQQRSTIPKPPRHKNTLPVKKSDALVIPAIKGVTALDQQLNLGITPLKRLKPEMFKTGPHFDNWKRKLKETHQRNSLYSNHFQPIQQQTSPIVNNEQTSAFLPQLDNLRQDLYQRQYIQSAMYPVPSLYSNSYQNNPAQTNPAKRQYQSLPFAYLPTFGVFKNRCPPKDLFTCRDVVKYAPCQSSEHCMGSSCCETQCQSMPRVCSTIYQGV